MLMIYNKMNIDKKISDKNIWMNKIKKNKITIMDIYIELITWIVNPIIWISEIAIFSKMSNFKMID